MNDYPVKDPPSEYGAPPESCASDCEKLCKGKTVDELNKIADYFRKEADDLDRRVDSTITSEDFEKVKSPDGIEDPEVIQVDNDGDKYNG